MDLKATLNLPDASFGIPMKADLPLREPEIQARWDEIGVYRLLQDERRGAPRFLLHDGPPYTNSPIHTGTALNKLLKDFAIKTRTVMGYRCPYVPGFDNHGLPIEQAVMKKFHEQKVTPTVPELRQACRDHAQRYVEIQTEQFKRIGVFGLWEKPYRTMDYRFEAEIVRVFKRLVERDYVYRGLRPVLWSPTSQTALADTEIVYQDVTSKAITVRFPLRPDGAVGPLVGVPNVYAVIWTTTPWTIPANLAVALHPEFTYVLARVGDDHYLVLEDLLARVSDEVGWDSPEVVARFKGAEVEGARFKHPVYDRDSVAVLADYVTTEDGTGIVHTAPGHGREDFLTGAKYGLPVLCPVDGRGVLTEEAGEFAGLFYKKGDTVIVDRLRELGALLAAHDYRHSYPHAERDGQPVIFRATEQWFLSIDHDGLRERMLAEIDADLGWFPRSGHTRLRGMIAGRPDWCVSRQRPWGVGIPVLFGAESGKPALDPVAIEAVARLIEREGSDAWFIREPHEFLPPGYAHPETGETAFTKETDVFDVWFDSGSTALAVLEGNVEPEWKEDWPADLYLEGSDQHRGWFNVSLILGTATRDQCPYRACATHGMVIDSEGQKMSKRVGNVVDPVKVCETSGADVLRYWAGSVDFEHDVPMGEDLLKAAGEGYRRIRNTLRFLLMNLYDAPGGEEVTEPLDRWVVAATDRLVEACWQDWERYAFHLSLRRVHDFCSNELSAFYLDAIKDRMYCDGKDWPSRRSGQAACREVLVRLVKLVAWVLPHTAEEVYARIPGIERRQTVFLEALDRPGAVAPDTYGQAVDWFLEQYRGWVLARLEGWRNASGVKDPRHVLVTLPDDPDARAHLLAIERDLPLFLKVAGVRFAPDLQEPAFEATDWKECARSRLVREDVAEVTLNGQTLPLSARDRTVLGL